jgi:hypothetical protein
VDDLIEDWNDASLATSDKEGRLTLHDLQHDYVRFTTPDRVSLQRELLERYRAHCPGGWHEGPDDGYFYGHLIWHLGQAGCVEELDTLLLDARWLNARLRFGGIGALLDDYARRRPRTPSRCATRCVCRRACCFETHSRWPGSSRGG